MSDLAPKNTKICHGCQAELPMDEKQCPYCHEHQLTRFEVAWGKFFSSTIAHHVPTTFFLILVLVVYFIIITIAIMVHPAFGFMDALMLPPGDMIYRWGAQLRGEHVWWRLVTANFVHIGLIHIAFNVYALRMVCPYVERTYGSGQTLFSFVLLGTGSMLCSNFLGGSGLVAGASGGLMAFIGMAAVSAHLEHTELSLEVRNSMIKWALVTFVFGLVVSLSHTMGIDNIAHVSGFVLGVLAGYIMPKQSTTGFTHLWMIRAARAAALCAVIAVVVAFTHVLFR